MAKTKTGKTTKGSRKAIAKRLGVKVFGGELVYPGNIILRQRGTRFHSGKGTMLANDFTIFAIQKGTVDFVTRLGKNYVEIR